MKDKLNKSEKIVLGDSHSDTASLNKDVTKDTVDVYRDAVSFAGLTLAIHNKYIYDKNHKKNNGFIPTSELCAKLTNKDGEKSYVSSRQLYALYKFLQRNISAIKQIAQQETEYFQKKLDSF
ncbi:MAG: hypothetical protein ACTSPH_07905 [Promethearchaeota archaeon]